jgi:rubrerythrin
MGDLIFECLERGMDIEKAGIKFYTDASRSIKDPKGKSTLLFLAKEEGRHLEYIKEIIDSMNASSDFGAIVQKGLPEIFPQKEEFTQQIAAGTGDKKILEEAMKVEERSIEFYSDCQNRAGASEKEIFETLVKEEEKHKAWLDYMKDGMDVHGYWYELGEYFAFDGS